MSGKINQGGLESPRVSLPPLSEIGLKSIEPTWTDVKGQITYKQEGAPGILRRPVRFRRALLLHHSPAAHVRGLHGPVDRVVEVPAVSMPVARDVAVPRQIVDPVAVRIPEDIVDAVPVRIHPAEAKMEGFAGRVVDVLDRKSVV